MSSLWMSCIVAISATFAVPAQGTVYKIMPVGDSITEIRRTNPFVYRSFASYRYFLWHQLVNSGRCVDFVGTETTIPSTKPWYNNFDDDHEGKWNRTAADIAALIAAKVSAEQPDFILLHAGSVDLFLGETTANTLTSIENIIDQARIGNPNVTILLAKTIPFAANWNVDPASLNEGIAGVAASKTTAQSPIVLVDHHTGWDPALHASVDGVHPYEIGELLMASNWFDALAPRIPTCNPAGPIASFSATNTTGPASLTVQFTDTSTGTPANWLWDFGDATTSTGSSPSHIYTAPGTYSVNLWVSNANGQSTAIQSNLVHVTSPGAPVADFLGSPLVGNAPANVSFTDASSNTPSAWLWTFGDGSTSTVKNPSHMYQLPGTYRVSLLATNGSGSGFTEKVDYVTINSAQIPTPDFSGTPTTGDAPLSVNFNDLTTGYPTSWLWTFGDGKTSTEQNPTHVYTTPGPRDVSLQAFNQAGDDTTTKVGYINVFNPAAPSAGFSGTPTTGDAPLSVQFTDESTGFPTSWEWDFGDGNTSTDENPSHIYAASGPYTVSLIATNSNGSDTEQKVSYITVTNAVLPTAAFGANPLTGDVPLQVSFTDLSTGLPSSWAWDFGDGNTSDSKDPLHTYNIPGTFTVALTVTNANGSDTATMSNYITVTNPNAPTADFVGNPLSGVLPLPVTFVDQSVGFPTSWHWDFGDGTTSAAAMPVHVYNTPGSFEVTLEVTNANGTDSKTRTDYVLVTNSNVPVADFSATPTTGEAPLNVAFTDLSTNFPTAWLWNFGDGGSSTLQNPSHLYDTPGTYNVQLQATNANGSDTMIQTGFITVTGDSREFKIMPFGDSITEGRNGWATYRYFLWHDLINGERCVDFVGSASGVRSGTPKFPNFDQDHEGHDNHSVDELLPSAAAWVLAAQPDIILCHVGSVDMFRGQTAASTVDEISDLIDEFRSANPSIVVMLAQVIPFGPPFGTDVTPLNNLLPAMVAAKTTAVSPVILVDQFSGWDTTTHSRDGVHPSELGEMRMATTWLDELEKIIPTCGPGSPIVEFEGTPTIGSAPLLVSFVDQSVNTPTAWLWDFGDGNTSALQDPSHTYASPGMYSVKLTATNANGTGIRSRVNYIEVENFVPPVADFEGTPLSGQVPLEVSFTDKSTNFPTLWSWSFGDGGSSSLQNPTHIYTAVGTYKVELTVLNANGSDFLELTDYITVTNDDPPDTDFTATPTSGNLPLNVDFVDTSSGLPTAWFWDFGDGNTSAAQHPSHTYTVPGTYTVELTATNAMGSDLESKTNHILVTNPSAPATDFSATPTIGSLPHLVQFTDESTGFPTSWSWNFGDGNSSTLQDPSHTYNTTGLYNVSLTATNANGSVTETKIGYIEVTPPAPNADFDGTPTSGVAPLIVSFTDQSTLFPTSWSWDFGDGTSSAQNPTHTYTTPGTYTVSLEASNAYGSTTETKVAYIEVLQPGPVADFIGFPTNGVAPHTVAFTDNSTGTPTSWLWEFGDGNTSTLQNPNHTYATGGNFDVKLTATNANGSDDETKLSYIDVTSPAINADFSGTPTSGDAPLTVQFTDSSTGIPTGWLWDFGDGLTSTAQNPSHIYTSPGTYTVALTASAPGVADTETRTNYINVGAFTDEGFFLSKNADFSTDDRDFDTTDTLYFKIYSDEVNWTSLKKNQFRIKDRDDSKKKIEAALVNHQNGCYTFTLDLSTLPSDGDRWEVKGKVEDFNGKKHEEKPKITVSGGGGDSGMSSYPFIAEPTSGDAPLKVYFLDDTTAATSWLWDFGDGGTSAMRNPAHIYTTPGTYTVTLTVVNPIGTHNHVRQDYIEVRTPTNRRPGPLKLMPFGDSITESRDGWASYRYFLWHIMQDSGHCADFVGSKNGVLSGSPKHGNFDQDHEGHSDLRVDQLAQKAYGLVKAANPELIVCHVGSTDLLQKQDVPSTVADIGALIDEFRRADPEIKILLAQVIPFGPSISIDVKPLNDALPALVAGKSTAQSPIILVDHHTGWDPILHSIDDVHPNFDGDLRMAKTWHTAIQALELDCAAEFETFGRGCAGSNGTPELDATAGERPILGSPFSVTLDSLPPTTPVIGIIGLSDASSNGLPLPMDLSVIGMPGCSLFIEYRHTQMLSSTNAGTLIWALPDSPNIPALAGSKIFLQAAVGDAAQNAMGITMSNAGAATLGVR